MALVDPSKQKFQTILNHFQVTIQICCFEQLKSFHIIQMTYLCNKMQ